MRSRAKLDYDEAQQAIDDGYAPTSRSPLLKEVGELRLEREAAPRRGLAAAAGAGDRRRRRPVGPGVPRRCCRSSSGTPRSRCSPASRRRVADGLRPGRAAAHPARRPTRATYSGCTAPRGRSASTGRRSSSTRTSSARWTPTQPAPRRDGRGLHPAAARQRVRRVRRRGARPSRSTPRWPPSTPTSPRRCAGSSTGTPARSASRCAPAPTCPAWVLDKLHELPGHDAGVRRSGPTSTSARCSTWSRPACWQAGGGDVHGRGRRGRRRRTRRRGEITVQDPAVEARVVSVRRPAAGPGREGDGWPRPTYSRARCSSSWSEPSGRPRQQVLVVHGDRQPTVGQLGQATPDVGAAAASSSGRCSHAAAQPAGEPLRRSARCRRVRAATGSVAPGRRAQPGEAVHRRIDRVRAEAPSCRRGPSLVGVERVGERAGPTDRPG